MAAPLVLPAMSNATKSTLHSFFGVKDSNHHYARDSIHENQGPRPEVNESSESQSTGPGSASTGGTAASTLGLCEERHALKSSTDLNKQPPIATATSAWPITFKEKGPDKKRRKVHHDAEGAGSKVSDESASLPPAAIDGSAEAILSGNHGNNSGNTFERDEATVDVEGRENSESLAGVREQPKKMLKLNASGTLGSPKPVSEKHDHAVEQPRPKKKGRPRRSLIVVCRYRVEADVVHTDSVMRSIEDILSGKRRHISAVENIPKDPVIRSTPSRPPKSTHPFFSGRPKKPIGNDVNSDCKDDKIVQSSSPERKSFASTPGKIRLQVQQMKSARTAAPVFSDQPQSAKRPVNAKGEIWPAPGTLNVRGLDGSSIIRPNLPQWSLRKKKLGLSSALNDTSILGCLGPGLVNDPGQVSLRDDGFSDPPPSLRVPSRSILTGPEILQRLQPQLSANYTCHEATARLSRSIPGHLTSYDHGRGAQFPWTQKYLPLAAGAVLQDGNEAKILRDWMKLLSVSAVRGSLTAVAKVQMESKPRKKRRKKAAELDDFIVSSGDEGDQIGSLNGLEELGSQESSKQGVCSLVRSVQDGGNGEAQRLANAVVLSGPHGCGKTALVMAVAKELDFQVFEINAGSRRSGRDVLERIGDVIGNHIVSHNKPADAGNTSADEDSKRISVAFQKDLDSGRQGTMNSFFTSAPAKRKAVPKPVKREQVVEDISTKAIKSEPSKNQKQSMILLEEVDILFEEDKSFWTTVLNMIASSRRPVVMTCTDEFALPWHELILHAELRLKPPSIELATDYLLLMAAQEGHLLDREYVQILYEQKRKDLRASIVELQFWCQMGIGDPRGGLSWIFQRWPPGTGIDTHGNAQRVVSEKTYHSSMGCFPCEVGIESASQRDEELLSEAWLDWGLDPRDDAHVRLAGSLESRASRDPSDAQARLESLRQMECLTDSLSALDISCRIDTPCPSGPRSRFAPLGSSLNQRLDSTQPRLSAKAKTNYTEYPAVIQADEFHDPTKASQKLAVSTCALLPRALHIQSPPMLSHLQSLSLDPHPYASFCPISASQLYASLEPLADPPASSSQAQAGNYTSLISPLPLLTTDIAPYVRLIATHDAAREEQRKTLHAALHGDVAGGKMRRTRAARGAMEGKGRSGVRREKWWDCVLDLSGTAGEEMWRAQKGIEQWCEEERRRNEDSVGSGEGDAVGDVHMSQE